MEKGNGHIGNVFAVLFLIVLVPAFVCALAQSFFCLAQTTMGALFVLLPWFLLLGLVIALGAGVGAGLTLRDRFPLRPSGEAPPLPGIVAPIRRAPEIAHDEDDDRGVR